MMPPGGDLASFCGRGYGATLAHSTNRPENASPLNLLLLSFVALALGPLLVLLARRHASALVAIDSFCVIAISGFALLHLLPVSAQQAGWLVFPLALAGFIAPALAERGLHHHGTGLRRTVLVLAMLGIAAHSILDGLALSLGHVCMSEHDHGHDHTTDHVLLAWAVILHRIPEGLGIWWIVPRTLGTAAAVVVTLVSVLTTSFGFFVAPSILTDASTQGLALVQALLAGSLLHVVLHAHIPAPSDRPAGRWHLASVLGAAAAVFVLWRVIHLPSATHVHAEPGAEAHVHGSSFEVFTALALESAPALLFAYLLVGLSNSFLPKGWLRGISKGSTLTQALKGVAIGLPLPVCSCGVVPLYREMIRQGASMAAAIAFLIATPELEIAAVVLTWQLLGPELAVGRVMMAALLALGVGMLVARMARQVASKPAEEQPTEPAAPSEPLGTRLVGALRFGFGPAIDNTATWILMGLLLSALLAPYIHQDWISALPQGLDVPIAALLGLPLYVCATGSTPLAAILLAQGVSPGAALALLLTGPATNVTTFGMLGRLHGRKVAVTFAAVMWIGTVLLGYATNALLPAPTRPGFLAEHHHGTTLQYASLSVLALLFAISLLRQGVRPFLERLYESPANLELGAARDCCAPTEPVIVSHKSCCDHDQGTATGHGHHHHHH